MKYEIRFQAIFYTFIKCANYLSNIQILTIDALAPPKDPSEVCSQYCMPREKTSPVFLHGDNSDVKSQDSPVAFFKLTTPFAHAALADNQNTATMTVKQKSLNAMKCHNGVKYRTCVRQNSLFPNLTAQNP